MHRRTVALSLMTLPLLEGCGTPARPVERESPLAALPPGKTYVALRTSFLVPASEPQGLLAVFKVAGSDQDASPPTVIVGGTAFSMAYRRDDKGLPSVQIFQVPRGWLVLTGGLSGAMEWHTRYVARLVPQSINHLGHVVLTLHPRALFQPASVTVSVNDDQQGASELAERHGKGPYRVTAARLART